VKQKFDPRQPSLFEEVTSVPPAPLPAASTASGMQQDNSLPLADGRDSSGQFHLVPHATFLAWPESVQWHYCAVRDQASAAEADSEAERAWYAQRAETYEQAAYDAPVPF
jgi:hypothetical protein